MPAKQAKGAVKKGGGKKAKGGKKKTQKDAFLKKTWLVVKVPRAQFEDFGEAPRTGDQNDQSSKQPPPNWRIGYTPVAKTKQKLGCVGRTFTVNLGDLQVDPYSAPAIKPNSTDVSQSKNFVFIAEDTFGEQVLTQFQGMEITRDKRCSWIEKWHTMIVAFADAKTTDGYVLRVKAVAFTKRQPNQVKRNCYAKHSQARVIRAKMKDIVRNHISSATLRDVISDRLTKTVIGDDIEKSCKLIFPLENCFIEKVKVLRKPKRDVAALMKIHDLKHAFDPIVEDDDEADAGEGDGVAGDGDADAGAGAGDGFGEFDDDLGE